jgi:ribonuclease Z
MLSSQVDRDDPLYIYGPPRICEYVEESRRVLDMYINYEIIVKEIESPGILYEQDDYVVRAFELRHTKPCMGYTLEEHPRPGVFYPEKAIALGVPRGPLWSKLQTEGSIILPDGRTIDSSQVMGPPRKGRKLSFVTDTQYLPTIASQVADSNLLICEGMFSNGLAESAREKRHLTAVQAAQIAREAGGIGKMGLIHYSPRYTERELKELLKESTEIFPDTFLTRDRQVIEIPNVD